MRQTPLKEAGPMCVESALVASTPYPYLALEIVRLTTVGRPAYLADLCEARSITRMQRRIRIVEEC